MIRFIGLATCVFISFGLPTRANERSTTPEAFVAAVYKDYGRDGKSDSLGTVAPKFFAPRLLKLIRADERVPVGEVGRLDEDPLCDCQDDGGFRLSSVVIDRRATDQASATVHFVVGAVPVVVALDLVTSGGEWRVADVHSRTIPSLVAFLSSASVRR